MQRINTEHAPKAIGPYSQAVRTGNLVFVSGQLPIVPETGAFAGDDAKSQAKQSLENIKAILSEVGINMAHIIKTTVLLKDIADFNSVNEVYATFFEGAEVLPARAAFQVAALPKGALVEIEAIAEI